jgi:hypothetical protein
MDEKEKTNKKKKKDEDENIKDKINYYESQAYRRNMYSRNNYHGK